MQEANFIVDSLPVSPFMTNCYILGCTRTRAAAIIDPGDDGDKILERLTSHGLELSHVLLTHAHVDHCTGVSQVRKRHPAPIYMHRTEQQLYDHVPQQGQMFGLQPTGPLPPVDVYVEDGEALTVGNLTLRVLFTPGHSPGSVCYHVEESPGVVFCGDVLFQGSIGRTDLWGGSYGTLMQSIGQKIMPLPDETVLYSGHGPATSVGRERASNPFRGDFKE